MGFFTEDETSNGSDQLIAQQNRQAEQEIEQKKAALFQTRLDIIKSQGGQNWGNPTKM